MASAKSPYSTTSVTEGLPTVPVRTYHFRMGKVNLNTSVAQEPDDQV